MRIAILAKIGPCNCGKRPPSECQVAYVYKIPHMYMEEAGGGPRKLTEAGGSLKQDTHRWELRF